YWCYDRHRSVRLVVLVGLAIDQIAQSGLSSLSVIYYSAQLFSNADAASGIAIEILNAADRSKLVFSSEKKYHTASESSIEIPLIAHYKRTGTVKAGTANAAMTFVINQY
ncbi:fimbrial protein, partial [Klebsiella pneumoniae]|uniref:fimbrial protein n=1 Tax=Klebsiella pneumoniae TaxID=573 RepID=UPI002B4B9D6F